MKWISVDEELPETEERIVVWLGNGFDEFERAYFDGWNFKESYSQETLNDDLITHWAKIEPPINV